MEEDIKSELNGNFLEAVLGLLTPVAEYEASILEKAMQGMGTNEKKITEILCSKDAQEIKVLREAYKRCKIKKRFKTENKQIKLNI